MAFSELILHVGTTKTGSTSLQNAFAGMLSISNIIYPVAGQLPRGGHHNLAYETGRQFRNAGRFRPEAGGWNDALAEIRASGAERAVISSETLSFLEEDEVKAIAALLKGYNTTIILYLRRQDTWLHSRFAMHAKLGRTDLAPSEYLSGHADALRRPIDVRSHLRIYKSWQTAFGAQNVRTFLYESEAVGPNVTRHFAKVCGIAPEMLPLIDQVSNTKSSLKTLVAATQTRQTCERVIGKSCRIPSQYVQKIAAFFRPRRDFVDDYRLFSIEHARIAIAQYQDETQTLFDLLGPSHPRFPDPDAREYACFVDRPMRLIDCFDDEERAFIADMADTVARRMTRLPARTPIGS